MEGKQETIILLVWELRGELNGFVVVAGDCGEWSRIVVSQIFVFLHYGSCRNLYRKASFSNLLVSNFMMSSKPLVATIEKKWL
jgi:hypothetical protein